MFRVEKNQFELPRPDCLFRSSKFFKHYWTSDDLFIEVIVRENIGVSCYFNTKLRDFTHNSLRIALFIINLTKVDLGKPNCSAFSEILI